MIPRSFLRGPLGAAVVLSAALAPRLAAAQFVDLPGTQPGGLAMGAELDSVGTCALACHFQRAENGETAFPFDTWMPSMMGNTMRDPLFLAALTVAEQDRAGVGDYCLRCHTPPGFVAGRTRSTPTAPRGTALTLTDQDGVSCDSCHRMTETMNLGNAQYVISPTETRFGPYATIMSKRHPGEQSSWLADSRMCGSCHEITNPAQPLRRADGSDTGQRFPLDTTYSEWVRSDYAVAGSPMARTCQDCHLPRITGTGRSAGTTGAMERTAPRRHDFVGSNAWGIRVMAYLREQVSSGAYYDPDLVPFYTVAAQRAEASLRGAVSLELRDPPTTAAAGATVSLTARITNLTGHRVPTGYADGRRMWIEVAVVDRNGAETVVSGRYNDAEAQLVTDPQLKIYHTIQGRAGMGAEEHIALHDTILLDTRLPPRGYRPLPGHEPVGYDYSGGEGGALRHWDDARYMVPIPATASGPVTLRVRARFQVTTREYVEFLEHENHTDDRGRDLLRIWNATGRAAPYTMVEVTAPLTVTGGPMPDAGSDAGARADAGADGGVMDSGGHTDEPTCGCSTPGSQKPGGLAVALFGMALAARRRRRR